MRLKNLIKKVLTSDDSKTNSPLNCLENNYLLAEEKTHNVNFFDSSTTCSVTYRLPTF